MRRLKTFDLSADLRMFILGVKSCLAFAKVSRGQKLSFKDMKKEEVFLCLEIDSILGVQS